MKKGRLKERRHEEADISEGRGGERNI